MRLKKLINLTRPTHEAAAARAADYRNGKLSALALDGFLLMNDADAFNAVCDVIGSRATATERHRVSIANLVAMLRGATLTARDLRVDNDEDSGRNINTIRTDFLTPVRQRNGGYTILRREAEAFFYPPERQAQAESLFRFRVSSIVQAIAANACELDRISPDNGVLSGFVAQPGELVMPKMHLLASQSVIRSTSGMSAVSLADAANDSAGEVNLCLP